MNIQKSQITFQSGLTSGMRSEIKACDTKRVSEYFMRHNINTDFKGNKVLAWCSLKSFEIIKGLNQRFGLKLGFPNGIFVEDFNALRCEQKQAFGFLNFAPTKLYSNNDKIVDGKTIFFNEYKDFNYSKGNHLWESIDEIADENFELKVSNTNFFLETIFHEFAHAMHEENLLHKLGSIGIILGLEKVLNPKNIKHFQENQAKLFKDLCEYAMKNPLETVACDISKRTMNSINKETLSAKTNFIKQSPYENSPLLKKLFHPQVEDETTKLLKNFWNGRFD